MHKFARFISSVAIAAASISTAFAADLPPAPAYKAPPVENLWNPWMIRVRALGVVTRDSGHVDQVPGSGLATSDTIVPELDISYFFTPNIAAELILGVTPAIMSPEPDRLPVLMSARPGCCRRR